MLSGIPSLSESMSVELVADDLLVAVVDPVTVAVHAPERGRAAGIEPASVGEHEAQGIEAAPSAAKWTPTPSLNPSPSVSGLFGVRSRARAPDRR
jgi:hypothetical protein